jgi:hypothetical protein
MKPTVQSVTRSALPIRYYTTVPRAYDMFRAYEGMDEETTKIK